METKICNRCKIEKGIDNFRKANGYKNGVYSECKICNKERLNEWRKNNPEKYKDQHKRGLEKRRATGWAYNLKHRRDKYVKHPKVLLPPDERARRENEQKKRWKKENPHKLREYSSLRRAMVKGAKETERIDPLVVFDRDNGICGICKHHIRGKYELDHIMPLSKGGNHTYKNIQLAHPKCNRKKHNKTEATMITDK
jgi:5-methylcytosine-specific restriction endonuclease McrA